MQWHWTVIIFFSSLLGIIAQWTHGEFHDMYVRPGPHATIMQSTSTNTVSKYPRQLQYVVWFANLVRIDPFSPRQYKFRASTNSKKGLAIGPPISYVSKNNSKSVPWWDVVAAVELLTNELEVNFISWRNQLASTKIIERQNIHSQ